MSLSCIAYFFVLYSSSCAKKEKENLVRVIFHTKDVQRIVGNLNLLSHSKGSQFFRLSTNANVAAFTFTDVYTASSSTYEVPAVVESEGSILLPLRQVKGLLDQLDTEMVTIHAPRHQYARIETPDSHLQLVTSHTKLYPIYDTPRGDSEPLFTISSAELRSLILAVTPAASPENGHPFLHCLCFERSKDGRMEVLAGDIDRVHQAISSCDTTLVSQILVPAISMYSFALTLPNEDVPVVCVLENGILHFSYRDTSFAVQVVDVPFELPHDLYHAHDVVQCMIDSEELRKALQRCYVYLNAVNRKVRLHLSDSNIIVQVNSDKGSARVTIPMKGTVQKPFTVQLDCIHLLSMLDVVSNIPVTLYANGTQDQSVVFVAENKPYRFIFMPIE